MAPDPETGIRRILIQFYIMVIGLSIHLVYMYIQLYLPLRMNCFYVDRVCGLCASGSVGAGETLCRPGVHVDRDTQLYAALMLLVQFMFAIQ